MIPILGADTHTHVYWAYLSMCQPTILRTGVFFGNKGKKYCHNVKSHFEFIWCSKGIIVTPPCKWHNQINALEYAEHRIWFCVYLCINTNWEQRILKLRTENQCISCIFEKHFTNDSTCKFLRKRIFEYVRYLPIYVSRLDQKRKETISKAFVCYRGCKSGFDNETRSQSQETILPYCHRI